VLQHSTTQAYAQMQRLRTVAAHVAGVGCSGSSDDPAAPTRQATGPLAGYRVLDMSAVISGPWSASILADQGADVIKIEGPARPDITRGLGSSPELGMAAMYVTANRGKRSVTLDLQQERGVEALKLMVKQSDVVIQNFRPGVNTRMGIDYAALSAVNPDLIMLTISGFGETGPYREARVYDPVIQAMAGVGAAQKGTAFDVDGKESLVQSLMLDKVTALNGCQAVTAALLARERGNGGQLIELNMLDAAVHFLFPDSYYNKVWETPTIPFPEWNRVAKNYDFTVLDGKVAASLGASISPEEREAYVARFAAMTRQEAFDWCLENG
jgi:crotonobetainyl-CoA:carnitine CoA-transferase CaiB-like acyl-CoA transferase